MERTLRDLITESHNTALHKGWWGPDGREDRPVLEQLCLMHSELSEACEEYRSGRPLDTVHYTTIKAHDGSDLQKPEGFVVEIADLFIRAGDTLGRYGLTDVFLIALEEKLRANKLREYRHGGKKA